MSDMAFLVLVSFGYGNSVVGLLQAENPSMAVLISGLGVFWIVAQKKGWGWFNPFGLVAGASANALCTWQHDSPAVLCLSVIALLSAWDLARYKNFIQQVNCDNPADLTRNHIKNIGIFSCIASFMSLIPVYSQLKIDFIFSVFLIIIVFAGLLFLIRWLFTENRMS